MASKQINLGPTGQTVADNVKRLRTAQNLTYAEMSRRLNDLGHSIPELGLRRIENQQRKVDTDDLMALAHVLNTTPPTLLMPVAPEFDTIVSATSLEELPAKDIWFWLQGEPLSGHNPDVPFIGPPEFINRKVPIPEGSFLMKSLLTPKMLKSILELHQNETETDGDDSHVRD